MVEGEYIGISEVMGFSPMHRYTQAQMSLFDGQDLVVGSGHSVVSVLLQYRLGLFGWFYAYLFMICYGPIRRFSCWTECKGLW